MSENTQVVEVTETYIDPDFTEDTELPTIEVEVGEAVTPYKAAALVNGWLASGGFDKELPPQMFYNYTVAKVRAGKKCVGGMVLTEGNKITLESLQAWYAKYEAKLVA